MMLEKLTTILQTYVEDDILIFENTALVADLGLDSLEIFSVVTRIEEEFDVEVSERAIGKMVVVQDIMDYLDENC